MSLPWFAILTGLWALATLVAFVLAVRLSYQIEERSEALINHTGVQRKAMLFHTVFNIGVARDAETQAMRSRMNKLLFTAIASLAVFAAGLKFLGYWQNA